MKKSIKMLSILGALGLGLFLGACSESSTVKTTTAQSTQEPVETSTQVTPTYQEVSECPIETGTYMLNNELYDFNKDTKKMIVTKYNDYSAYKSNQGEKQVDTTVKYISYNGRNTIYFVNGDYEIFIFKNSENKIRIRRQHNGVYGEYGFVSTANIVEPTYGTYVSTVKEKTKTDAQGNPVPNGDGGYEVENFYVFLVLTETSAKVYLSDNNTTYDANRLLRSLDNYRLELINGFVYIRIPHGDTGYKFSSYVKSATEIHFTEDSEGRYDYGSSGIMTKIA